MDEFDAVIVGAGTAGCVLAERLSASGKLRVLLLEAGGKPGRMVSIPAAFPKLFNSECDWAFTSEPQTGARGRRIFTPRGKMLGGSSNMNAMMHQWCHPADFDGWVAAGASGWSWDEVAPIFRAQEQWQGEPDPSRGNAGPMRIVPNRNARSLTHLFVDAARRCGLPDSARYNGQAYQGAWVAELAVQGGKRYSAYHAYLKPALTRSNLTVLERAEVRQVLIEHGRAVGVRYRRDGHEFSARAAAVVLAAGAFGSPQLMMLSGIGEASHLAEHGIAVVTDRPEVGRNLQDHPTLPLVFASASQDTLHRAESLPQLLNYLLFGRGMLASNGVEGFAFTQVQSGPVAAPDLELLFLPFEHQPDFLSPPTQAAFAMGPAVIATRSRGRLKLQSADPFAAPSIDFALLSDPEGHDLAVLLAGIELTRKIARSAPLAAVNLGELAPGAGAQSPEQLLDYAGTCLQTVYHPSSTCRMGSDTAAVVDPRLKVNGIDALWIADASVMPSVPRGHPNAVIAMIANRASAWIEESLRKA